MKLWMGQVMLFPRTDNFSFEVQMGRQGTRRNIISITKGMRWSTLWEQWVYNCYIFLADGAEPFSVQLWELKKAVLRWQDFNVVPRRDCKGVGGISNRNK